MVVDPADCSVDVTKDPVVSKRNAHRLEASDIRVGSIGIEEGNQLEVQYYPGQLCTLSQEPFEFLFGVRPGDGYVYALMLRLCDFSSRAVESVRFPRGAIWPSNSRREPG